MKNKLKHISLLLLSILLVVTITAGCASSGKKPAGENVSGSESEAFDDENPDEFNSDGTPDDGNEGNADDTESGTSSGTSSGTGSKSSAVSSSAASNTRSKSSEQTGNIDPEKYRGTTVRYATWKDPAANEDGIVVSNFQKKYGITVKIDMIPQAGYVQTLASYIAAGNSPDICFDNNEFPATLSVLQPLSAACLNTSDPIWDQSMFKASTVNNKVYLANTISNIWGDVNCLYYNKKLFANNGIPTPEELYKAGNWTWKTMYGLMQQVKALGSSYYGAYIDPEAFAASVGTGFYKYQDGKLSNSCTDNMMLKTYENLCLWYKEGLLAPSLSNEFVSGKAGMVLTNSFGLKKTGYFSKMNGNDIGFSYLPDYDANTKVKPSGLFRGWGIVKNAPNPVGAGIFLRYYLDTNNYDTRIAFVSPAAESFFYQLTGVEASKMQYYMTLGVATITGEEYWTTYTEFYKTDPAQIGTKLNAFSNVVSNNVTKANAYIASNAK